MTVIAIDTDFIVSRLNDLPPHSRLRAGYCDMLRHVKRAQIEADVETLRQSDEIGNMLASALELALSDLAAPELDRLREVW